MDKRLSPIHPGEVLLEDFMRPFGFMSLAVPDFPACVPLTTSQKSPSCTVEIMDCFELGIFHLNCKHLLCAQL